MLGKQRFIVALMAVTIFSVFFVECTLARMSAKARYDAAKSFAGRGNYEKALEIMHSVVRRNSRNADYNYFTALLEFKTGRRTDCQKRCDRLLKRRSKYGAQILKLKRLAQKRTTRLRQAGHAALAGAGLGNNSRIYATAMENQKRFVDSGYNNVAGRVLAARRRSIERPRHRPVSVPKAFEKFIGTEAIPASQYARAMPSAAVSAAPPAYSQQYGAPAPAPAPASAAPAPPADNVGNFDNVFEFDDAFSTPVEAPSQPAPAPTQAAPAPAQPPAQPAPVAAKTEPVDFGDFGDTPVEKPDKTASAPAPTKAAVTKEHMKPIPVPKKPAPVKKPAPKPAKVEKGGDDFGDFGDFGGDDDDDAPAVKPKKPAPKKPTPKPVVKKSAPKKPAPVKKPEPKKPAANDGGGFDSADFGDFGDDDDDDDDAPSPKKPEPKKPAPAASGDDDDDDDDFDAFDGF